jgi:hypothetical protein
MFGVVEDDFYGLVGRIVLVAALLEDRPYVLYGQLAIKPPDKLVTALDSVTNLDKLAGAPDTQLISESRKLLHRFWPDYREEAEAFFATPDDIEVFAYSANNRAASGDGARHARRTLKGKTPDRVMSIEEGQQFIRDLARRWLDSLS